MQTTIMVSIFVIQLVTSIFGAHYLLNTPSIAVLDVEQTSLGTVLSIQGIWTWITEGTWGTIIDIVNSSEVTRLLGKVISFSWNMMLFNVPGVPDAFSYIWLVMTFVVLWILVDKIRGHNT